MGKRLDDLSKKLTDAVDEVSDTLNQGVEKVKSPETKEKAVNIAHAAGDKVTKAADVLDNAFNGFINEIDKGIHNK